jgi:hypothetical protein
MCPQKSNVDGSTGNTSISTILSEKIFLENTNLYYHPLKADMLKYLNDNKITDLYLFSEDTFNKKNILVKQFYCLDYKTVYLLSKQKKFHLYENFEENEKIKLFIDIDIKDFDKNIDRDIYFDEIINKSINLYVDELKKYNIINPQIIILKSSSDAKLSSHIIFNDVIFDDIYHIKYFFEKMDSDLINNNIIDKNVYKTGCFRLLWNSKLGKNINLEYYKSVNYKYTTDRQLFYDCLLRNIPEKHQYVKIDMMNIKQIDIVNKSKEDDGVDIFPSKKREIKKNYKDIINKININTMELLIDCLNDDHFLEYDSWRDILFICYNCNNNNKIIDFLTKRSRIGKYINISRDNIERQFYSNGYEPDFNKLVLYSYAKKDNRNNLYDRHFGEHYDDYEFEYDKIDMNLLDYDIIKNKFSINKIKTSVNEDNKLVENKNSKNNFKKSKIRQDKKKKNNNKKENETEKKIEDKLEDNNNKYCVIKSRYGSGKTTFIKKLIEKEYLNKRIIFLTMRQSLARNINKDFKELGFINYLDANKQDDNITYEHDKIIISLDSIKKITYNKFMKLKINPYDLVICDEFCSLLSHFDYNKLQEPELLHKIFESIIKNSTQTFFLDGDISNREILYLQKYFDYRDKPLFNINTGTKYNISVEYNADKYFENLTNDLKNNKKICVVSMASNFALDVYNKYCDDYKCLIIYGKTDDKVKSKLENVEDLFTKYDLIIYTPTITVGVDFNKKYFDKIYGYICLGSVCPRVFFQMLFRIRQINDPNIMILSDNKLSMKSWSNIISFEEIKFSMYGDEEINSYQYIRTWNKFENDNSHLLFLNIFSYYCKLKNFDLIIDNKIIKGYNKEKINYNVIDIYNADIIDKEKFSQFMINIKNNNSTKLEKISVEKYIYANKFDLDFKKMKEKDFKKYYQKLHVLKGFILGMKDRNNKAEEHLLKNMKLNQKRNKNNEKLKKKYDDFFEIFEDITTVDETYYNNCFDKNILDNKYKYYQDLINLLELNNKRLERDKFIDKVDNIFNIISGDHFRTIYSMGKIDKLQFYEDGKINTKLLLGKLNSIFDNFGVQIKNHQCYNNGERDYYYKLESIKILPKKYRDYFNFMYKSIYS